MKAYDVVGYVVEIDDTVCTACLKEGEETDAPIFAGDEWDFPVFCQRCGDILPVGLTSEGEEEARHMIEQGTDAVARAVKEEYGWCLDLD